MYFQPSSCNFKFLGYEKREFQTSHVHKMLYTILTEFSCWFQRCNPFFNWYNIHWVIMIFVILAEFQICFSTVLTFNHHVLCNALHSTASLHFCKPSQNLRDTYHLGILFLALTQVTQFCSLICCRIKAFHLNWRMQLLSVLIVLDHVVS